MAFRVGQKVVCIDDTHHHPILGPTIRWILRGEWPVRGHEYIVARSEFFVVGLPAVELVEIKNFEVFDRAWRASRFRPAVERETDISIFTEMLNPSKEHVRS